ncbi:hypothetical protein QTL95_28145 [Rhizobium sp. S152]|uniref:hypothetical protein n=1 Tax=Rhizobium sp. S152 TaxID=3055038 RepID=UPI0025A9E2FC|nr:hypothetical protein [Rhizobium sp. S152]MDM9629759.1 hypothetical protein [Rhizobium sp. S152]
MRSLLFAAALLLPQVALAAQTLKIDARAQSCGQIAQVIRQNKTVFVRVGFGGHNFRYPPAKCALGSKRTTVSFRDATGRQCTLDYACAYDPGSFYNNP